MAEIVENTIPVPEDVQLTVDGRIVTVSGVKGKLVRDFGHTKLEFTLAPEGLRIRAVNPRKLEAALVGTITTHVKNMIKGASKGFVYKMKIVFVHFPTGVKVVGNEVHIENFVGERKARSSKIVGETKVTVKQDDVILEGNNIEDVSQTAAGIQQRSRVRHKDLRKFLDGIYVYSKE